MTLATRKPTGEVGFPMILVEGREGTRKTSEALSLSADPRVGAARGAVCLPDRVIQRHPRIVPDHPAPARFLSHLTRSRSRRRGPIFFGTSGNLGHLQQRRALLRRSSERLAARRVQITLTPLI